MPDSLSDDYALRLKALATPWWKRALDVQAPYRWNLRRLRPGYLLDIGCGIGRNLQHVNGRGVGVDPNRACVREASARGLKAYTPEDFLASAEAKPENFDSILIAHVIEHIGLQAGVSLLREYIRYLKPGGQVILVTPQEAGYRSDATHVEFIDTAKLLKLAEAAGLKCERAYSFPFPRAVGRVFPHNEFVVTARLGPS